MSAAEMILVVLFVAFLIGTILKIVGMLERKRAGGGIDRARLVFFFLGSLMLVSMVPMRIFGMLTEPVMAGDLAVVVANFAGYALTYQWGKGASGLEEPAPRKKVRAYQIYYHGRAYALITKEGIDAAGPQAAQAAAHGRTRRGLPDSGAESGPGDHAAAQQGWQSDVAAGRGAGSRDAHGLTRTRRR